MSLQDEQPQVGIESLEVEISLFDAQENNTLVMKQYDSHTMYNKPIPYYNGRTSDKAPTIE